MNKFEFINRYIGTIGHFDPRLSMVANHVRAALVLKYKNTEA